MNWPLLVNSLSVSALATAGAVGFGLAAALWLAGLGEAWRRRFLMAAGIALVLPPFLVTGCWIHLLGQTGVWRPWLNCNIYSLMGTAWILMLLYWPLTLFLVLGAWRKLEPALLESDLALSGWPLIRWLFWPLGRTAVAQAATLTFVLALNNFAVPAILQVKVFPAEMWVSFNTTFNYLAALRLSWPLAVAPLLLLLFLHRSEYSWPRLEGPASAALFRQQLGRGWWSLGGAGAVGIMLLSVVLPVWQLTADQATWQQLLPALDAGQSAVANTVLWAAASATIGVSLGLLGWRWRWAWLWWLVFLAPGVLLGLALIFLLNRPPFLAFYHSAAIVVMAWTLRYLALAWNGAAHARQGVDRDLTDAARLDGATGWALFRHVHWPQMAPTLAAVWLVTYLLCLWDVETLVLIVPPGGETLALRIFNLLHYGHNPQVNALCLWLLVVAALPYLGWQLARWIYPNWAFRGRA